MICWILLLVVFSFTKGSPISYSPKSSGNYFEVNMDHFDVIKENKDYWEWHLKLRKVNKTRSLVGMVEIKKPIGNDFTAQINILKKQGGEYRYLPYGLPEKQLCEFYANDTYVYPDVAKNSDLPEDIGSNCPIQPGNYTTDGVSFSLENFPKLILSSGDYATELIYRDPEKEICGVYRIYAQVHNI
ncbi:hypothetical protein PVAND_003269 [Polypedilum vanderplanki]|uniref:MD-2-related lipid-recognition domain-containing protein n=1 Tax=Polypedilum vanderplanki TaxID=319348 RepID=A0A9J6BU01_POLVA|nr:hypothetical protein PVAND_003269 [Polypedilum vanderplanki]